MNDIRVVENFKLSEFQCKGKNCCGNVVKISSKLVTMLQALRGKLGVPLIINSGYRCKEHNTKVGGSSDSYHGQGLAVDIACPKGWTVEELTQICLEHGFTGVGSYPSQGFVHVDVRPGKQVRFQ